MLYTQFYIIEEALKQKKLHQDIPDEVIEYDIDNLDGYEVDDNEDDDSVYVDLDGMEPIELFVIQKSDLEDGDEIGDEFPLGESVELIEETVKRRIIIHNGKKKIRFFSSIPGYKIVRSGNSIREVRSSAHETKLRSKQAKKVQAKIRGKRQMTNMKARKTNRIRKLLIRPRKH